MLEKSALEVKHGVAGERRVSEGEPLLRQHFPDGDVKFAVLARHRALIAKAQGNHQEALDFANQAVLIAEAAVKESRAIPLDLQAPLVARSQIHLDLGHLEEALGDAKRLIQILVAETPPETLTTHLGNAYLALGRALRAQGKSEEATEAIQFAVKHLQSALGPDHPETRTALRLAEEMDQPH